MEREPWLLVQEGSKLYLLAKDQKDFVFITVNKALTAEKEEQLARSGSFSNLRLQELGLAFRVLPDNQVRGVAMTGSEAGETLYFYPASGKKQKYVFSDDYEQAQIDAFFEGVERFTAPTGTKKKKKNTKDWRKGRQDPKVYEQLKWLSTVMTIFSFVFGFAYRMRGGRLLYLASLMWLVLPIVLDIAFPAYFSLILPARGEKKKARNLFGPVMVHGWLMSIGPGSNWLDGRLYLAVILISAVLATLVLGIFAEEFRRQKANLLAVFLIAGAFGMAEAGHFNKELDFSEPEVYTLAVEELDYTGGKNSSYRCTVTLPDGREAELEIKADFYKTLESGDPVRVEVSTGALGIEYASVYPLE